MAIKIKHGLLILLSSTMKGCCYIFLYFKLKVFFAFVVFLVVLIFSCNSSWFSCGKLNGLYRTCLSCIASLCNCHLNVSFIFIMVFSIYRSQWEKYQPALCARQVLHGTRYLSMQPQLIKN